MSYTGSSPSFKRVRYTPQSSDPANPLEGDLHYSDGTARPEGLWVYKNGAWEQAGSNPTVDVNYIENFGAEADTTGWATYADAAAAEPVDGTGGAPNITLARTTNASELIYGEGTFELAKDAANRQGEGVSYDFVVQRADYEKSNILNITFNYRTSAAYANNDISVFVYDKDGTALVPVWNDNKSGNGAQVLAAADAGRFAASFYTTQDNNDYRVIFHIASTNASAYDFWFDNVSVSPQPIIPGAIVTPWAAYTPTLTGFGTPSNVEFQYRRVGDELEIRGSFTSGTSTAVEARISFPPNLTSITASAIKNAGVYVNSAASTNSHGGVMLVESAVAYFTFGFVGTFGSNAGSPVSKANGNTIVASGESAYIFAKVPIANWTAGASLSTTETLMMTAKLRVGGDPASASSGNPIIFPTVAYDTHSAYNNSTGRYTAPRTGYYRVHGFMPSANTGVRMAVYVNAVSIIEVGASDSNGEVTYSGTVFVNKGDLIDLRPNNTFDTGNGSSFHVEEIPDFSIFSIYGNQELISSDGGATPAAYSITAGQWGDMTSIALTPGEWDVDIELLFLSNGATTTTNILTGLGSTSGNNAPNVTGLNFSAGVKNITSGSYDTLNFKKAGLVVSTNTTYYLKAQAVTSITNLQAAYKITARRIK